MKSTFILVVDAVINFTLGVLLLFSVPFSSQISNFLGVPKIEHPFYPSLFGSILFGIGIALLVEFFRKHPTQWGGLGLGGAIAINMCGGIALIGWLVFGDLNLPLRGVIFLWVIAFILVGISILEVLLHSKKTR